MNRFPRFRAASIIIAITLIALPMLGCPRDGDEETIINVPPPDVPFISGGAVILPRNSSCEVPVFRYDVNAQVVNLPAGVGVVQITMASQCGGSGSINGQTGHGVIDLVRCEDATPCKINLHAILTRGAALDASFDVTPCADMRCEFESSVEARARAARLAR